MVAARWDDCADQAVLARTRRAPDPALWASVRRLFRAWFGVPSAAAPATPDRRMRARGGRGKVAGDRAAGRGSERTRRAGALGRHRDAVRAGPCPRVGGRRSGVVHQRHLGTRHRDGTARRPAAGAPPSCSSISRATACRRPTCGRALRSASRRSTSSRACSTVSASTRSRSWGTRSADCSRCGSRSTGRRVSLGP